MKKLRLIILLLAGFLVFIAGVFIPTTYGFVKYLVLGLGALAILIFYLTTLIMVLKSRELSSSFRILWTIVVICVPVLGNALYLLYCEMINRKQNPVQTW